jgi:hypothetical protein
MRQHGEDAPLSAGTSLGVRADQRAEDRYQWQGQCDDQSRGEIASSQRNHNNDRDGGRTNHLRDVAGEIRVERIKPWTGDGDDLARGCGMCSGCAGADDFRAEVALDRDRDSAWKDKQDAREQRTAGKDRQQGEHPRREVAERRTIDHRSRDEIGKQSRG